MATIKQIRQKYPQYNDLSDEKLADSFYDKFYSDIPKEQFYQSLGVKEKSFINKAIEAPFELQIGLGKGLHNLVGGGVQLAVDGDKHC
jgi:hypothetical protein